MYESKLVENVAKWELDYSKLSAEDIEVLTIVNFPKKLGYNDAAQMRIKRMKALGGYIDKPTVSINDITFTVTSKKNAQWWLSKHSLPANATDRQVKHLEGVMKSKSRKFVYFDGNSIQELMDNLLSAFSTPKPTANMVADTPKEEEEDKPAPKKRASRKHILSDKEKKDIEIMANEKSMDVKEISEALKVPQTVIKEHLKSLKNG